MGAGCWQNTQITIYESSGVAGMVLIYTCPRSAALLNTSIAAAHLPLMSVFTAAIIFVGQLKQGLLIMLLFSL